MTEKGWPADWEERKGGKGCPLCRALNKGDNEVWVHVANGRLSEVHLERRSPVPGYCIVAWAQGHVCEPAELEDRDAEGYWREVLLVGRAIDKIFRPLKLNYMTLGNTVPHLHTHIIPRYADDPAPGGPIPWDTIFSAELRDDDELHRQAAELRLGLGDSSFTPY